jgi:hypothetical protein
MPRGDGPHTRNSIPGRVYRGSGRRVEQLSPFADLPSLLLIIAVALLALGFCAALMYQAL